jgi:hypothetical protein
MGARDTLMKAILFFVFGTIAMTVFGEEDTHDPEMRLSDSEGVVYYEGFDVERFFPLTEETIEEHIRSHSHYVYRCAISKSDLLASIVEKPDNFDYAAKYNKNNTRAKAVFSEDDVYFIDIDGMMRHGSDYLKVNKKEFKKRLKCIKSQSK